MLISSKNGSPRTKSILPVNITTARKEQHKALDGLSTKTPTKNVKTPSHKETILI
jgi:hypothetical protein